MVRLKLAFLVLGLLFAPLAARAANCPGYSYVLTNGQLADANQVMANFNTIMNCANNVLATQAALTGYAPIASPAFTGTPTAPTGTAGDTSTQIATDQFAATVAASAAEAHSLQSGGQVSISAPFTLTSIYAGANLLIGGSGTITFPTATGTFWLSNVSGGDITLSFPTGTDYRTTMHTGEQIALSGDGGGFWRVIAAGLPLYGVTQNPGDNTTHVATTAFVQAATAAIPAEVVTTWANVTCTSGGCTVNGSKNVSSVTRISAGTYQVNFTAGYPDTHYAPLVTTTTIFMAVQSMATGSVTVDFSSAFDGQFFLAIMGS